MVSDAFRIQHHAAQETILFRHFRICSYCCHDRLLTQGCSDGVDHGHLGSFRSATAALREVQIGGNYGLQHIETMVYIGLCLVFVSLHVFSHGFNGFIGLYTNLIMFAHAYTPGRLMRMEFAQKHSVLRNHRRCMKERQGVGRTVLSDNDSHRFLILLVFGRPVCWLMASKRILLAPCSEFIQR